MDSEGLHRRIDRLLDEADDAISKYDWEAVRRDAHAFLAIDPEHSEGLAFLATAERELATLALTRQVILEPPLQQKPQFLPWGHLSISNFLRQ